MKGIFLFSFMLFLLVSCTTREVAPTRESRLAIDTIFQQRVAAMQSEVDSMCAFYMDSVFHHAVDSMIAQRQAEINQLVK
jgi:hypothetical protein